MVDVDLVLNVCSLQIVSLHFSILYSYQRDAILCKEKKRVMIEAFL